MRLHELTGTAAVGEAPEQPGVHGLVDTYRHDAHALQHVPEDAEEAVLVGDLPVGDEHEETVARVSSPETSDFAASSGAMPELSTAPRTSSSARNSPVRARTWSVGVERVAESPASVPRPCRTLPPTRGPWP